MSDDTSIDLVVFQIIAEREHGSLVATHEPSALESTQEVTLCTFDEITEIWFDDKDINQVLILVQPRRILIQRMLTQHHSYCQSFSVYVTLPDYLSEFVVPVRIHDLFGELHGYIQSFQTVQSIQNSDKSGQGVMLFCIRIDLSFKRSHFDLLVQSEPGFMDLVLARQEVYELGILEDLRKSPHIYKMDVGKRNGCFRINLPEDVISIRIYCLSSSLEAQKAIFGSLQPIFDAIKYTAVKECQIKNCTPWNDDEFILANGHLPDVALVLPGPAVPEAAESSCARASRPRDPASSVSPQLSALLTAADASEYIRLFGIEQLSPADIGALDFVSLRAIFPTVPAKLLLRIQHIAAKARWDTAARNPVV